MMIERYFLYYQGFTETGGLATCGNMVVNSPHKLETAEHMKDLAEEISEEVGYLVVITSLFHMCTIKKKFPLGFDKWM